MLATVRRDKLETRRRSQCGLSRTAFRTGARHMGTEGVDRQQQKAREFMALLPLTLELAGLPKSEPGRPFGESQLEARAMVIRAAYKAARQIVVDLAK